MIETDTTIVAVASPPGPAVRGIVRMSGPEAMSVLTRLTGRDFGTLSRATRLPVAVRTGPPVGEVPADAMIWPDGRCYTGQPSVEIHTFGSPGVLAAIVAAAINAGARPAGPGEFTLRAFLAGRLDLTQAEAVLGVIDAADPASLKIALEQLAGNLGRGLDAIRGDLLDLLADVEAGLDFVDEDLQFVTPGAVQRRLLEASQRLAAMTEQLRDRGGGGEFFDVAIVGQPNVGKSSLINAIAGRCVAIVSDTAGTTRDLVQTVLAGSPPIRLTDTAGIELADPASVLGRAVAQSHDAGAAADLVLQCRLAVQSPGALPDTDRRWSVQTKSDLVAGRPAVGWPAVSSLTGAGIPELIARLRVAAADCQRVDASGGTAARAASSLAEASAAIHAALTAAQTGAGDEWVAGEIRLAVTAIGQITGAVHTDDLLDRVFSRFCIGK